MKIAIVTLLAVIAAALVIIVGYIAYNAIVKTASRRIRIASEIGMSTRTTRPSKRLAEMSRDTTQHFHRIL
jgi:hypothetical protein